MKLVEIHQGYIGTSEVIPTGVSCRIFRGSVTALLHRDNGSTSRQQVLDVSVQRNIRVVSFNFKRGLEASRLSAVRVGDNLVMQIQDGIVGFDVYRADEYLSPDELVALERISQTPSVYYVR